MRTFASAAVLIFISSLGANAQDLPVDQPLLVPLLIAPSNAGGAAVPRASMYYRRQWPEWKGGFHSAVVSYDLLLKKSLLGIGGYYGYTGDTLSRKINSVHGSLSYHIVSQKNELRISPGLEIGYINGSVNVLSTAGQAQRIEVHKYDIGVSAYLHFADYYLGAALQHINSPKMNFGEGLSYTVQPKLMITAGANILVKENRSTL